MTTVIFPTLSDCQKMQRQIQWASVVLGTGDKTKKIKFSVLMKILIY